MPNKNNITFLDLVIPLCCIYISCLCFYSYFYHSDLTENPVLDVIVIFTTACFFCYGVVAFFRDIKQIGIKGIVKSWNKFFK